MEHISESNFDWINDLEDIVNACVDNAHLKDNADQQTID